MKTNDAVTKICNVAPYFYDLVSSIKNDAEIIEDLKNHKDDKIHVLFKTMPKLIKANPDAVYSIIGELFDKTADEVKEQAFGVTIAQLKEIFMDKDLKDFFTSFGETTMEEKADVVK